MEEEWREEEWKGRERRAELIEELKVAFKNAASAVVHRHPDVDVLLGWIETGAHDFLYELERAICGSDEIEATMSAEDRERSEAARRSRCQCCGKRLPLVNGGGDIVLRNLADSLCGGAVERQRRHRRSEERGRLAQTRSDEKMDRLRLVKPKTKVEHNNVEIYWDNLTREYAEALIITRSDGTTVSLADATIADIEDYRQQQLKKARELEADARLTGISDRGAEVAAATQVPMTPALIETESDALLLHWRRMAAITLEAEPLDLGKLQFCVKRMVFWQERMTERANSNDATILLRELEVRR